MTRLHPFSHVFAPLVEAFATVRAEAAASHRHTADRMQFASLASVRQLVATIEDPVTVEGRPEAPDEYLSVLHVAYRFWEAGEPTLLVPKETFVAHLERPERPAVDDPIGVAYARLPERWIWAQVAPDAPHEPLDGFFLALDDTGHHLTVVAILGLRADRPGFGQIVVHASPDDARAAFAAMRSPPFAPILDGGAAAGLRSIVTQGELVAAALLAAALGVPDTPAA